MLKIAKAIGANTDLLTAQAFTFSREESLHLIFLVSASGEDVFTKIRQRAFEVEEQFFSTNEEVSVKLSKAISFFKDLEGIEELKVLLGFISENILYLESDSYHQVFLSRDGKRQELTVESKMVSGYIQDGDRLLFITSKMDGEARESGAVEKFLKVSVDELEDCVEEMLHESGGEELPDPVAVILVENQPEEALPKKVNRPSFKFSKKLLFIPVAFFILALAFLIFSIFNKPKDIKTIDSTTVADKSIINQTDWPVFLSIDLIKTNFVTSRLSFSLGKILLLDDREKTLVLIDIAQKTPLILAGSSQLGQASIASLNADNAFVYSEDKGLLNVNVQSKKVTTVAKPDSEMGRVLDIYGFASNLYVAEEGTTSGKIWKYAPIISGYSDKIPYLKGQANFSGAKRMIIDYSVWVTKDQEVFKFTGGANDSFSVSGLSKNIGEVSSLSVPEEGENLYILDKPNSRIVVLTKSGVYKAQYVGDKFKSATDITVDLEGKKIYLLEGGKIYALDLKD